MLRRVACAQTYRTRVTSARVSAVLSLLRRMTYIVLSQWIKDAAPSLGHTVGHKSALLVLDASKRPAYACGFHGEHQQQYENARVP
jgi:hypothetical protein